MQAGKEQQRGAQARRRADPPIEVLQLHAEPKGKGRPEETEGGGGGLHGASTGRTCVMTVRSTQPGAG